LSARAALLLGLVVLLAAAPAARADGDPASDYLLSQKTFIPPDAGIPAAYQNQLNQIVSRAKSAGYEIRVALISSPYDLGSVTVLNHKPKEYARFLGQELSFVYRGRLLVVMPDGFGFAKDGKPVPSEQAVLDRLPPPGKGGTALASSATRAVNKLAANSGVVVPVPTLTGNTSNPNQNYDRVLIVAVTALVVIGIVAVRLLRRRTRKS
jgi:hypothetical protein